MVPVKSILVPRHCVAQGATGASPMQEQIGEAVGRPETVFFVNAPTGAGKTKVFLDQANKGHSILFIVPTRRLGQALYEEAVSKLGPGRAELWTGDQTQDLLKAGQSLQNIRLNRLKNIQDKEGIIFATPDTLSGLIMRRWSAGNSGLSYIHPDFMVERFSYIVIDEFHLLDERSFSFSCLFALMASGLKRLQPEAAVSKIMFLSATPTSIAPALLKVGVLPEEMTRIDERITQEGRALHGDVVLDMLECPSLMELAETFEEEIQATLQKHQKVLVLFDSLLTLQKAQGDIHQMVHRLKLSADEVLIDSSIDRQRGAQALSSAKIVFSTSTFEQGLTIPDLTFAIIDPGLRPMNFLQRFGRVSRKDVKGHVVLRLPQGRLGHWTSHLQQYPDVLTIEEFSAALAKEEGLHKNFPEQLLDTAVSFGTLSSKAAYAATLYYMVLLDRMRGLEGGAKTMGNAWASFKRIEAHLPEWSKVLYAQMEILKRQGAGRTWVAALKRAVCDLRNIGTGVRIKEGPMWLNIPYAWVAQHTTLLESCPQRVDEKGWYIEASGKISDYFRERSLPPVDEKALNPSNGTYVLRVARKTHVAQEWIKEAEMAKRRVSSDQSIEGLEAAILIVRLTGIFPWESHHGDDPWETQSGSTVL